MASGWKQVVLWVKDGWGVKEGLNGGKRAAVMGVCDSATIVALPSQSTPEPDAHNQYQCHSTKLT